MRVLLFEKHAHLIRCLAKNSASARSANRCFNEGAGKDKPQTEDGFVK